MTIDPTTLLFFDASCLIAAAGSPSGGSGFLLSLCAREFLRGAVSQVVLLEAERNIERKLGAETLLSYHRLLQLTPLSIAPVPLITHQQAWHRTVNEKDWHVAAAALAIHVPYLLTLDQGLKDQINRSSIGLESFDPGSFIKLILPRHVSFSTLRP